MVSLIPKLLRQSVLPVCAALVLTFPCLRAAAQTATARAQATAPAASAARAQYRIAGHLVSGADGRPLQRATVQILTTGDYKPFASTVAGEDGGFAFAGVKAGAYVLEGSAPGYLTSRYDAHGVYSTAIVTGAGVETESLVLKLTPEAGVYGRVTDEAGEPVRRAGMTLYRRTGETGITRTTRFRNAQTDDTGAYEMTQLPPGTYFLSATATPWYAVHPLREQDRLTIMATDLEQRTVGMAPIVDSIDPSLDVAYPATFYPYATNPGDASPVQLKAGDQSELDIRLTPQTAVTLTVPRATESMPTPPPPGDPAAAQEYVKAMQKIQRAQMQMQLQRKVFDDVEGIPVSMNYSPGRATFTGLAPGQYVLRQVDPQTGATTHSAELNLTERTTQADLATADGSGALKVQLKTPDGAKLPPHASVQLFYQDPKKAPLQAVDNDKGEVVFHGVDPGDCYFSIASGNKRYFVTKLLSDAGALPGTLVHIAAGANASVTAIADPASSSLSGFAKLDGKPAPGARIVLLPEEALARTHFLWQDQSDLDGSFHLKGIPPGRYRLLAIQDGWEIEWQSDGAFDRYLPQGTSVVVPGRIDGSIALPTAITVQSR